MEYEHHPRDLPESESIKITEYNALKLRVQDLERIILEQGEQLRRLKNQIRDLGGNINILAHQKNVR
jgi:hypothetical protein